MSKNEMQKLNAHITDVYFGREDHGFLSINVSFKMEIGNQGTGHYSCGTLKDNGSVNDFGVLHIIRLLNFFNVDTLDDLIGKACVVFRNNGAIVGVSDFIDKRKTYIWRE